jgi:histidinol dehydrogenase
MSSLTLRFRGPLSALTAADVGELMDRATSEDDELVRDLAAAIIDAVRHQGDTALRSLAREYDGVSLTGLEVDRKHWDQALDRTPGSVRDALVRAKRNLEIVHTAQVPLPIEVSPEPGIRVVRRPDPLRSVGIYVPGGRAAYPSSVLMGVVPARVAGVPEIIVCSPPVKPSGRPSDLVLAACALAGASRVFAIGGAGAIAAMAYGTATVPKVERIVGPGNAHVAAAKILVANRVAIDGPAGPSELLIIADETADPSQVAREMIAQAEHDERAAVITLALDRELAARIETSLSVQVATTSRSAIVKGALGARGAILTADSRSLAVAFANVYAPEHLLLAVADAEAMLPDLRAAGAVFVGRTSSVVFGDYATGANHTLPTGGSARSYSGLSVLDFFRWTSIQSVTAAAASALALDVGTLATAEGLDGHARAAAAFSGPAE